jgi:HD-GYP domain-containing protein (c-di-GMP phosphodiesterase class II)
MPLHRLSALLFEPSSTLTGNLEKLHDRLLETVPGVDRIACVLYDSGTDALKTFINSTRSGVAISAYEYKLADSHALSQLAASGEFRVIDDIAATLDTNTAHTQWLREQGYQSSFTVPLYDSGKLLGFVFFDSLQANAFNGSVQRDLVLFTNLISMTIAGEVAALRTMLETARVARELAEVRDFETGAHLERMSRVARLIAKEVAQAHGKNDEFVESVYLFAPLHDIGKIGIPDSILLKPGRLNPEERAIMETHVEKGMRIIDRIVGTPPHQRLPDSPILRNIVHCHHEYLNGTGYPRRLKGEEIPLEARIVTVADIFDALAAPRPYKQMWTVQEAMNELDLMVQAGQLDSTCVQALHKHQDTVLAILQKFVDETA